MHASSLENMAKCYKRYISKDFLASRNSITVLDVGSADVNGSYRSIFSDPRIHYIGADLQPGPGVDLVLEDSYKLPLETASVDVLISGQALEHCEYFWLLFEEMIRVLSPAGLLFLITPSSGPVHRYPVDCYRFYPDAYQALAKYTKCHLIDSWVDGRGPWKDLVGVFAKQAIHVPSKERFDLPSDRTPSTAFASVDSSQATATSGREPYLKTLSRIHKALCPDLYLEIGVRDGGSLRLAHGDSIGVDPNPNVSADPAQRNSERIYRCTSDAFFDEYAHEALKKTIDVAFIDGMHLFEYILRDFMNIERHSKPTTLVVIDDIYPNHALQCERVRKSIVWTGDVWKIAYCLREYRPDLTLIPLDTSPTGLLLVAGLSSDNNVLWENYNSIVRKYVHLEQIELLGRTLSRADAINPGGIHIRWFLTRLNWLRRSDAPPHKVHRVVKRFHISVDLHQ